MDREPNRSAPQVGDAGKYTILKRLAVGGMAEIFLAEAANIHGFRKKVVIKRMLPQYQEDQLYVDMFLDEARLVARLNHPSVVQVFDIGEDSEGVFFTMEYVEGRDLSEILGTCYRSDRLLSFSEVLAMAIPAAEGLHHAHEARDDNGDLINLIHRDVSPSNVIVTSAGRVKLLDFGVAKSKSQSRETTGISLKGKFGYMAPEQCEGLTIDRRCDVYSFGVVLWELFTGKRLHGGGNEPQVLVKIMTEDPSAPSTKRPDIPPALDAIVLKALARNRDERYSTMQELLVDLDKFMADSGTVINSRTLSTMLVDIFAEERPTIAMAVMTPSDLGPQAGSPQAGSPQAASPQDARTAVQTPPPAPRRTPPPQVPSGSSQPYTPSSGSNGGHGATQSPSSGGHASPGSNPSSQYAASPGSNPSSHYTAAPGSNASGEYPLAVPVTTQLGHTGPMPLAGRSTPSHGYATLQPGSQFDQGSEIVIVMKSRKGIFMAMGAAVLVLFLGILLLSSGDDTPAKSGASEEASSTAEQTGGTPEVVPTVVPTEVETADKTPEEIEAAARLAEEKAKQDKALADKSLADKAAAAKALADKAAAAQALADKAAAAKAAAKATADKAAADKAAAKAAAEKRAADRKAAAELRNANKTNDKKPKTPKWDPNSPFAPQ